VSTTVWERDRMAFCGLTRTVAGAVFRVPRLPEPIWFHREAMPACSRWRPPTDTRQMPTVELGWRCTHEPRR
jgi:hypothetical protein